MPDNILIPLKNYMAGLNGDVTPILEACIALIEALHRLHKSDPRQPFPEPDRILINPAQGSVIFTDSVPRPVLTGEVYGAPGDIFTGDTRCISPEETGRLNLPIDERSDLYRAGLLLYEFFTGKTPYEADSPGGMLNAHIAVIPRSPAEVNSAVPVALSLIIMKLLAKSPDERYQSAASLRDDLKSCLNELRETGGIRLFIPGETEGSKKFRLPDRLYGRHNEIQQMMQSAERLKHGESSYLFISGPPGIGKTFLASEAGNIITPEGGHFISGKFDQYIRDIPFYAFIQAFRELVRQLLMESSDSEIDLWKNRIQSALSINGKLITDVIPELEHIIGGQKKIEEMPPLESQNRFCYTFLNFIQALASADHPLIIFLDDLQWADAASIRLMRIIFSDSSLSSLFFIGAYRGMELRENLTALNFLQSLETEVTGAVHMKLKPVNEDYMVSLLEDIPGMNCEAEKSFSSLVINKTNGNPLFIREFLTGLSREGYIYQSRDDYSPDNKSAPRWVIDYENIKSAILPDNIIQLITMRIKSLEPRALSILQTAACIGMEFSLELLSRACGENGAAAAALLNEAVSENIILKVVTGYKFSHDNVREALMTRLNENERASYHYKIGKILLNETETKTGEGKLADTANQLNLGSSLMSWDEKNSLLEVNLAAGKKALSATAYAEAYHFFKQAAALLSDLPWNNYKLTLDLYTLTAEAGHLCGSYSEIEFYIKEVLENARDITDRIRIYEIKIAHYSAGHMLEEAWRTAADALGMFDFHLPQRVSRFMLLKEAAFLSLKLKGKKISYFERLPECGDSRIISLLRLLISSIDTIYVAYPEYITLLTLRMMRLIITHGNCYYSPYIFSCYAILDGSFLGNTRRGYLLGRLALEMIDRYKAADLAPRVNFIFGAFIGHWVDPYRATIPFLLKSFTDGMLNGDNTYASYGINSYMNRLIYMGGNLDEVLRQFAEHYPAVIKLKNDVQLRKYRFWHQFALNLSGRSPDPVIIRGELCDEDEIRAEWTASNNLNGMGMFLNYKMILCCLHNRFPEALQAALECKKYLTSMLGMTFLAEYNLYYSLAMAGSYPDADRKTGRGYLKEIKKNQKRMKKWAAFAPENFSHKYLLIQGELERLTGRPEAAATYREAIREAHETGFLHMEALAHERAALYHLEDKNGDRAAGAFHIREAAAAYLAWGARGKVRDLEEKYHDITRQTQTMASPAADPEADGGQSLRFKNLSLTAMDLETIRAVSDVLESNQKIEHIMRHVLEILIRGTGAQQGWLYLNMSPDLSIYTGVNTSGEIISVNSRNKPPADNIPIPLSVIRYALRTGLTLLADDAARDSQFSREKYIAHRQVKSLLCLPLLNRSDIKAVLYLENSLLRGVFDQSRVDLSRSAGAQLKLLLENRLLKKLLENKEDQPENKSTESLSEKLRNEYSLTPGEARIALLLKEGVHRDELCARLNITSNTFKNHMRAIYNKTINLRDDHYASTGRIDKLSSLILFLMKLEGR